MGFGEHMKDLLTSNVSRKILWAFLGGAVGVMIGLLNRSYWVGGLVAVPLIIIMFKVGK